MATKKPQPKAQSTVRRDSKGRLAKGSVINPTGISGDPQVWRLKRLLGKHLSEDDIAKIGKKLCRMAKAGNVAAAKELFDRMWGKAKETIDVDLTGTMTQQAAMPMSDEHKIALCVENGLMHLLPPALRERAEAAKPKALPPEIVGTVQAVPVTRNGHK